HRCYGSLRARRPRVSCLRAAGTRRGTVFFCCRIHTCGCILDMCVRGLHRGLAQVAWNAKGLTNRWSQPLAVVKSTFDFMKQFPMLGTFAPASGGSGNMIEEGSELSLGDKPKPKQRKEPFRCVTLESIITNATVCFVRQTSAARS